MPREVGRVCTQPPRGRRVGRCVKEDQLIESVRRNVGDGGRNVRIVDDAEEILKERLEVALAKLIIAEARTVSPSRVCFDEFIWQGHRQSPPFG